MVEADTLIHTDPKAAGPVAVQPINIPVRLLPMLRGDLLPNHAHMLARVFIVRID